MSYLKNNFIFLREQSGKNQSQLSILLGFSRGAWNNYEQGKSKPSLDDFIKIAKYFGHTASQLLETDLSNVEPNKKISSSKKDKNVEPNNEASVDAKRKKKVVAYGTDSIESVVNDDGEDYMTAPKMVETLSISVKGLEAANAMLHRRIDELEKENANLKREAPGIGKQLGAGSTKTG